MKIPKVEINPEAIELGKVYLMKLPCGELRPVQKSKEYPGWLDEWDDTWEMDALHEECELYGPIELETL